MTEETDPAAEPSVKGPEMDTGLSSDVTQLSNEERLRILAGVSQIEKKKKDHLDAVRVQQHKQQRHMNMVNTNEELRARIKQQNAIIGQQERQLQLLRQETYLVARQKAQLEKLASKDIALHVAHCQKRQSMHEAVTKFSNDELESQMLAQLKILHAYRLKSEESTSKAALHLDALRKQTAELELELRGKRSAVLLDENCLRLETAASPIRHQMLSAEATRVNDAAEPDGSAMESTWAPSLSRTVVPLERWKHHTKETCDNVMMLMQRSHQLRFKMNQLYGFAAKEMASALAAVDNALGRKMAEQRSRLDAYKLDLTHTQKIVNQLENDRKIKGAHDDAALMAAVLRTRETLRSQRPETEFVSDEVMVAMRQEGELFKATESDPQKVLMERNLMLMSSKARSLVEKTKILSSDFLIVSRMASVTDTIPDEFAATLHANGAATARQHKSPPAPRSRKVNAILPSLLSPRDGSDLKSKTLRLEMHDGMPYKDAMYSKKSFGMPTPVRRDKRDQLLTMTYSSSIPRPPKYLGTGLDFLVDSRGVSLSLDNLKTVKPKKPHGMRAPKASKSPRVARSMAAAEDGTDAPTAEPAGDEAAAAAADGAEQADGDAGEAVAAEE